MKRNSPSPLKQGEKKENLLVLKGVLVLAVFICLVVTMATDRLALAYVKRYPALRNCTCPPVVASIDIVVVSVNAPDQQPLGPSLSVIPSASDPGQSRVPQVDKNVTQVTRPTGNSLDTIAVSTLRSSRANLKLPRQPIAMSGPACVFVTTNGEGEELEEAAIGIANWWDASVALFTSSEGTANALLDLVSDANATLHVAHTNGWSKWVSRQVQQHGSSDGFRGQLSIPLFHWISQLVKRNDPLVQNCKWFMKCDTDTYLRRGLLEREVLNKLDHTHPTYGGVFRRASLKAKKPSNETSASAVMNLEFDYALGGPGYAVSRSLLESVNLSACVDALSVQAPQLLLGQEDASVGYCLTHHRTAAPPPLVRVALGPVAAASSMPLLERALTTSLLGNDDRYCISCVAAAHPVSYVLSNLLRRFDVCNETMVAAVDGGRRRQPSCELQFITGSPAQVGDGWKLRPDVSAMAKYWLANASDVDGAERSLAQQAQKLAQSLAQKKH